MVDVAINCLGPSKRAPIPTLFTPTNAEVETIKPAELLEHRVQKLCLGRGQVTIVSTGVLTTLWEVKRP